MTSITHPGIPSTLTLDAARDWLKPRISARRFAHSEGVVETAGTIATKCGANEFLARLAGWLHDACKEVKDKELVRMAKDYGLKLHPIEKLNGHLLHGPVAAELARHELSVSNQGVLDAIAEHTLGAVDMTPLSQILFLADALEPGRSADYVKPIWQALHPCVWPEEEGHVYGLEALKLTSQTKPDLDQAILVACDLGLADLIECGRLIHPKTVDVRNHYLQLIKARAKT